MLQLIQRRNLSITLTELTSAADAKLILSTGYRSDLFFHQKERSLQIGVKVVHPYALGIGSRTPLDTKMCRHSRPLYKRGVGIVGPPYPRVYVMQTELHLDCICISISYLQYSEL